METGLRIADSGLRRHRTRALAAAMGTRGGRDADNFWRAHNGRLAAIGEASTAGGKAALGSAAQAGGSWVSRRAGAAWSERRIKRKRAGAGHAVCSGERWYLSSKPPPEEAAAIAGRAAGARVSMIGLELACMRQSGYNSISREIGVAPW
jgi:hypothetical protein